jgi:hypothetical protein
LAVVTSMDGRVRGTARVEGSLSDCFLSKLGSFTCKAILQACEEGVMMVVCHCGCWGSRREVTHVQWLYTSGLPLSRLLSTRILDFGFGPHVSYLSHTLPFGHAVHIRSPSQVNCWGHSPDNYPRPALKLHVRPDRRSRCWLLSSSASYLSGRGEASASYKTT